MHDPVLGFASLRSLQMSDVLAPALAHSRLQPSPHPSGQLTLRFVSWAPEALFAGYGRVVALDEAN